MITLALVLNPGWLDSLGAVVCQAIVLYVRKKRKAHLSKYPLHFLEQSEDVNIISLHIYVHKCFVFIYTYNIWTYMHMYVYTL